MSVSPSARLAALGRSLLIVAWFETPATAQTTIPSERFADLPAFLDTTLAPLMEKGHVPGAAVAVVHEGRVIYLRGFGLARTEDSSRVDPARTLFRIGSVSKVLTAVGAMQLAAAGAIDLHQDIRRYVPDIAVPHPVTTHQLLTHTSGLIAKFAGAFTLDASRLQPLAEVLHRLPEQQLTPGRAYSYSNYNTALSGLVIERVSGRAYDDYMETRVFAPLGMHATTARQPPEPGRGERAQGYEWDGRVQRPLPFIYTQVAPSGGISTTAGDMARAMIALLEQGRIDGVQALSATGVERMLANQYTPDSRIPGHAYEMLHWQTHGLHLLHKDGTLDDQLGVVVLDPTNRWGIFAASNAMPHRPGASFGNDLLEPLLTFLAGPSPPPAPVTPAAVSVDEVRRLAGTYRTFDHSAHEMSAIRDLMPMMQQPVVALDDRSIEWQGKRWVAIEPLVFRAVDASDVIVFRENANGATELHAWTATYGRLPWWLSSRVQLAIPSVCLIGFVSWAIGGLIRLVRRRRMNIAAGASRFRLAAALVTTLNLLFFAGVPALLPSLGAVVPLPAMSLGWLMLPIVSAVLTVVLVLLLALEWRQWPPRQRITRLAFSACAVAFIVFLERWSLLGLRY
jgi:CubicO group peptidase (beta-lactamase class C family)